MKYLNTKFFQVLILISGVLSSSAYAIGPVSYQVWNNATIFNASASPSVIVDSTEPLFTVYVKTITKATADYYVYLQISPDGTNWSSSSSIWISKLNAANTMYKVSVNEKALKVRLYIGPAEAATNFSASISAWIVN